MRGSVQWSGIPVVLAALAMGAGAACATDLFDRPSGRAPTEVWFRAREGMQRLSIRDALAQARQANPTIHRAELAVESATGDRTTAGLRINPNATALLFGLNKPVDSQIYQLVQTFETGGKRRNRVEVAKRGMEIADRGAHDATRVITGGVRQTFIRVLRAISDVEFAFETLASYDRTMNGPAEEQPFRVTTERIDLANELDRALLAVELAKHDLAELLASPDIWRTHDVDGGLAFLDVALTLRQLEQAAFENRPDWQAAQLSVKQAHHALDLARSQRSWNVSVGPSLQHVEGVSEDGAGMIVSASPQIFNRNQGEIHKANAEIHRAEEARRIVELAISKDLRRVHDRFIIARRIVRNYLGEHLTESRSALQAAEGAYRANTMTLTDYLDTLRSYRRFHFGYRAALADYLAALTDVNLTCGRDLADVDRALTLPAHAIHVQRYVPNPLSGPNVKPEVEESR